MQNQQPTNEELCNLLVQGLVAKDEKLLRKVLEQDDDAKIKDIINHVPVNHVRRLVIELGNLLTTDLTVGHLRWLQHILALKYSVLSSMADGRSILLPITTLLNDKSCPAYLNKLQALKGKIALLKQLRELRQESSVPETIVWVPVEPDKQPEMELDSATDTESEEDFDDEVLDDDKPENTPAHIANGDELERSNVEDEEEDNNEEEDQDEEDEISE